MPKKAKSTEANNEKVWAIEKPSADSSRMGKITIPKLHITLAKTHILQALNQVEQDGGKYIRGTLSVY